MAGRRVVVALARLSLTVEEVRECPGFQRPVDRALVVVTPEFEAVPLDRERVGVVEGPVDVGVWRLAEVKVADRVAVADPDRPEAGRSAAMTTFSFPAGGDVFDF